MIKRESEYRPTFGGKVNDNPQTGEAITIEARHVLTFKPSVFLRQAPNE